MLKRKKLPPEPRSCQKVRKSIFEYFFTWIYIYGLFLLILSVQEKIKKSVCAISFAKSECEISHFEMFVPSIFVMGTKAGESNFEYFFK